MAAVVACGEGAVLSHRSAAELWGILGTRHTAAGRAGTEALVEITVAGDGGRGRRRGIRLHRSPTLSPADCTRRAGIPVTNPPRTLTDLHRVLPSRVFTRACREAEFLGLPLGGIAADHTRSELEARFLALARRHRLPQPEVNVRVGPFVVDFFWRAAGLIVELDGWEAHRGRSAFEEDRARDARLKVMGNEVLRFTWRQVSEQPREVVRTLRACLPRA